MSRLRTVVINRENDKKNLSWKFVLLLKPSPKHQAQIQKAFSGGGGGGGWSKNFDFFSCFSHHIFQRGEQGTKIPLIVTSEIKKGRVILPTALVL